MLNKSLIFCEAFKWDNNVYLINKFSLTAILDKYEYN